jgi:hypothetical protein
VKERLRFPIPDPAWVFHHLAQSTQSVAGLFGVTQSETRNGDAATIGDGYHA